MLEQAKQIAQGWKNNIFRTEEIEKLAEERLAICRVCPKNSEVQRAEGIKIRRPDEHCRACGCTLSAKTRCPDCECPLNKWSKYENSKSEGEGPHENPQEV